MLRDGLTRGVYVLTQYKDTGLLDGWVMPLEVCMVVFGGITAEAYYTTREAAAVITSGLL
eukprot:scaffold42858_cov61-Cyclotella_meneghiniana.AAC.4